MDWGKELENWLLPFLDRLQNVAQRRWMPLYVQGLLGPGERKSVEAMAERVAPGNARPLQNFLSAAPWSPSPLEELLAEEANRLVGGSDAVLVIDDTPLLKKGEHSVGVAHQYCSQLGKTANCQVLVSTTLAQGEVPVCIGLRLYLPEEWATDIDRCCAAGVPLTVSAQPKWRIALDEIDRVRRAGATFGCVLGDAEYGKAAAFRAGLVERGLTYAVGILSTQHVYPADVSLEPPPRGARGRPASNPVPSVESRSAADFIAALPRKTFRRVSWRAGTKGAMRGDFAAVRVRVADGKALSTGGHLPGAEVWLVCERRSNERKFYVTNHRAETPLAELAAAIKGRWVCEQGHQQMKEELGLDHCECRNWLALHHHALLTMIALCFLQHLRLREKNGRGLGQSRTATPSDGAPDPSTSGPSAQAFRTTVSTLSAPSLLLPEIVMPANDRYLIQSIF